MAGVGRCADRERLCFPRGSWAPAGTDDRLPKISYFGECSRLVDCCPYIFWATGESFFRSGRMAWVWLGVCRGRGRPGSLGRHWWGDAGGSSRFSEKTSEQTVSQNEPPPPATASQTCPVSVEFAGRGFRRLPTACRIADVNGRARKFRYHLQPVFLKDASHEHRAA
jgi:hypothetical protein